MVIKFSTYQEKKKKRAAKSNIYISDSNVCRLFLIFIFWFPHESRKVIEENGEKQEQSKEIFDDKNKNPFISYYSSQINCVHI